MNNIFDETVKTLTDDAQSLTKKLHKLQENNDFKGCIDVTRLLKDTLSLIKEYDWHLEYSEYTTSGSIDVKNDGGINFSGGKLVLNGEEVRQVSVWEQNHSNDIRNHKIWNVNNGKTPMYIDYDWRNHECVIFYDGKIKVFQCSPSSSGDYKLIEFIDNLDKNTYEVFIDRLSGGGVYIADLFNLRGINVKEVSHR